MNQDKQPKIVTITCLELKEIGYPTKEAYALINELTAYVAFTVKNKYVDVIRNGKAFTHYQAFRVLISDDIIRACDDKIAKSEDNKAIKADKWKELKVNIIKYQKSIPLK